MNVEEFELAVRREVHKYLEEGKNTDSSFYHGEFEDKLTLRWRNKSNDISIRFSITVYKHNKRINFVLDIKGDDGVEFEDSYTDASTELPESEEDYFQLSTIEDMVFSWKFYEYITDVIHKIRYK